VEEDQVREYINKPDTHKSLGLAGMHLQVLIALCQLSLKGHCGWGRFLKTGRKQMSLLSLRKERRRIQGTTGW